MSENTNLPVVPKVEQITLRTTKVNSLLAQSYTPSQDDLNKWLTCQLISTKKTIIEKAGKKQTITFSNFFCNDKGLFLHKGTFSFAEQTQVLLNYLCPKMEVLENEENGDILTNIMEKVYFQFRYLGKSKTASGNEVERYEFRPLEIDNAAPLE